MLLRAEGACEPLVLFALFSVRVGGVCGQWGRRIVCDCERAAETANSRKLIAVLQAKKHCAKSAHGNSGNGAGKGLGYRAEMGIHVRDDVLHDVVVETGFGIGHTIQVPAAGGVGSDDDEVMARGVGGKIGSTGPVGNVGIVAVQKIQCGIATDRTIVINWQHHEHCALIS